MQQLVDAQEHLGALAEHKDAAEIFVVNEV
jgi:hypothetical protein